MTSQYYLTDLLGLDSQIWVDPDAIRANGMWKRSKEWKSLGAAMSCHGGAERGCDFLSQTRGGTGDCVDDAVEVEVKWQPRSE